ncbi:MAG: acyl-ACP--UDP-N-acetylglucosamine O-acyltransferase [Planctomycetota bacterium]|jgi:UDP-N-acetylglucosamine acyltransferase
MAVHPTAILDGEIDLGDDVAIGPHCVLTGSMTIGPGTRLIGHVYLNGPLEIGSNNVIYPFSCLGYAPQHAKYDPTQPGKGLVIGSGNTIREHVTIHRAFTDEGPTTIGDGNFFMATSHAGHDCRVADNCVFVNNCLLGGHVIVEDGVTVGGGSVVHQFCRLGRGAMLSGAMGASRDIPPFFMLTGTNVCGSVNVVGLRRSGLSRDDIEDVRWVYRTLYREGRSTKSALEALRQRGDRPLVAEYIAFVESSERGICSGKGKAVRGEA